MERPALSNGLSVVVERSPQFGNVGVVLSIAAGSTSERANQAGLSHLVEHLVFQSRPEGARRLWQRLGDMGGGMHNGMTSWDEVTYFAFAPEHNLNPLLTAFAQILSDPLAGVDEADFQHELQIVRNEMHLRTENGTPGQSLGWLSSEVFPSEHGYHRPVIGTHQTLSQLRLEDARTFASETYRSAAATLVVSAPYPPHITAAMARRAFGDLPPRSARSAPASFAMWPSVAADDNPSINEYQAAIPAPTLWLGWEVPGAFERTSAVPALVAAMIGGAFWSNAAERDRDIARVEAKVWSGRHASLFTIHATLNEGRDPAAAAKTVLTEMRRGLMDRIYGGDWLSYIKRWVATEQTFTEEHAVSRLLHLATSTQFHGDPRFLGSRGRRTLDVTSNDLAEYVRKHLDPGRARAIIVRPFRPDERAAVGETGVGTARSLQDDAEVPDDAQLRRWMRGVGAGSAQRKTLANGLEVIVLPMPASPFQTVLVGFKGGEASGSVRGAGRAALWGRMPTSDTPLSARGAHHESIVDADAVIETLRMTGNDVSASTELLGTLLKGSSVRWPTPQFTVQLQLFEKEYQFPASELDRHLRGALYGDHVYGAVPSPADLNAIRANHVYEWKDRVQRPENAAVVIVGDVDAGAALASAGDALSSWRQSAKREPPIEPPAAIDDSAVKGDARVSVVHLPRSTQAKLLLRCLLPRSTRETAPVAELFERTLGDRLRGRLRQETGASYGVGTSVDVRWGGTVTFSLGADIDYPHVDSALRALRSYLEIDSDSTLHLAAFMRTRANMARAYGARFWTTADVARALFDTWKQGYPLSALDEYPDTLLKVPFENIVAASNHCRQNWVVGLLGDAPTLRAAWQRAAGSPRGRH